MRDRRREPDRGSCGECRFFSNDPRLLGDVWAMDRLGAVVEGLEDENDPAGTGFCLRTLRSLRLVAEDTPACARKVDCI